MPPMGCSVGVARETSTTLRRCLVDLRYDVEGFNAWADQQIEGRYGVAWLKVGFVLHLAEKEARFPIRQVLESMPGCFHLGAPPKGVQIYYASSAWQEHKGKHADPNGHVLQDLAKVLKQEGADHTDLVFFRWSSMYVHTDSGALVHDVPKDSCAESKLFNAVSNNFTHLTCYWEVRTIVLPRMYDTEEPGAHVSYIDCAWCMMDIVLAAYCQQLVSLDGDSASQELITAGTNPGRFDDLQDLFLKKLSVGPLIARDIVWNALDCTLKQLVPIRKDFVGFAHFCNKTQIAWLYVGYVKQLVIRGGPFPRRQELHPAGYLVGVPPAGARKFVVSHCWETEVHPNPAGGKMRRLLDTCLLMQARDNDVIFFDFCSFSQENKMGKYYKKDEPWEGMPERNASAPFYFANNNVEYYPPRSAKEMRNFDFALWEMGRLYCFCECEVIVLPSLDGVDKSEQERFPGGSVWGFVNAVPYENRGWCCAEFSIALFCQTIKNLGDEDVKRVRDSRQWPEDNRSYAEMMGRTTVRENARDGLVFDPVKGVDFTSRGDRAVVQYNFFKMALGFSSLA